MHPSRPLLFPRALVSQAAAGWLPAAIDLVFPPRCVFCRQDVDGGGAVEAAAAIVCEACAEAVAASSEARCGSCGETVALGDTCGRCRSRPWRSIAVLGGYDGALRQAVLRCKRVAGDDVCRGLASLWLRRHGRAVKDWNCECVVPVPLHWTRRLVRGASATDTLAATIARGLGLPLSRTLRRVRPTRMQNELPPEDRPRNVQAAFRCRRSIRGTRVLLVDDVVTTGATVAACSRELIAAGAGDVFVATMAKADRSDSGWSHPT